MERSEIGLIGLGTMGAALSLNIAEKGFRISVFNRTVSKVDTFLSDSGPLAKRISPTRSLEEFVTSLKVPRAIVLMVPAGDPVDAQIAALRPLLDPDDLIIDAGNANFHDTNRRAAQAVDDGVPYLGIGVSGGEDGARHGPSIMGGGDRAHWDRVAHILEAISARYEGQPCATWMGEGGAGHFVKTVHNGIEYADMQLIAETYGVMRDGMGMPAAACADVFASWNQGPLQSYLVEIAAEVSAATDPATGAPMLDVILDRAGQKGTGRWTVIESQQVGAPVPVIEAAVAARNLSAALETRRAGEALFGAASRRLPDAALSLDDLEAAMIAGKVMCYAQGFDLLARTGTQYGWTLPMPEIAEVWREGCIIRSAMLNDMAGALRTDPDRNLLFAPYFADLVSRHHTALRKVAATAATHGLPVPALSAALGYFDSIRTARSTANMIQAQRDFFGAHGFERIDAEGQHHGPWGGGG
ncbi:6-phosphogluconate dehydrogenase (decarboxylating) [Aliiruegeria haliotis]|uniref:6-phosphogluconate dehydrogenase, decarboxylating n=1 Tax=Aliiruegeria haliotis TaxID=1280846 RepID=A0A2T0S0G2_9RHOB|nr:NADP-dependent phosphogluconate dehydrogenase [Aliiruegeria haliotis]PRY26914.1 6-phosphogluconate dehydrogenase (decarboxylating) [Aliiruegeria haliotis]